jgi:hypothetical protein
MESRTDPATKCERRGLPVLAITERYFGDGSVGRTETATICEWCLATYASHAAEVLQSELRAMFARRAKIANVK